MPSTFNEFVSRIAHYPRGFWERHVLRWGSMRARADATSEKTYLTLLRAPEPSRRWQAAAGLSRHHLRSAEAITALIEALCDDEPIVRWQVAEALAAQEASHAFPAVSAALDAADPLYFDGGDRPVKGAQLGTLNAGALAPGTYSVRIVVVDASGNFPPPCQTTIVIR